MLALRRWLPGDAPALIAAVAAAPDLVRQVPTMNDEAQARAWIATLEGQWVFALCRDDEPVGQVAVTGYDERHGTAWFSYWSAAHIRGTGAMSRAAATVADWALRTAGVRRLELGHRTNNPASGRVAERAGFVPEGIERAKLVYDGEAFDVRTMSRLASDLWPRYEPISLVAHANRAALQ